MIFLRYVCCLFLLLGCQDASFYQDGVATGEINLPDNREQDEDDNIIDQFRNCDDLNHGESIDLMLFEKQVVEFGEQCKEVDVTKSCDDGIVSYSSEGELVNIDDYFEECEETDALACGNIPHGGTMTRVRFQDSQVAFGGTCESETQTSVCYNGSLSDFSGSYSFETCNVGDAKSCDGLGHGSSETRTRFETPTVVYGGTCNSEEQTRTCNNGTVSDWSGTFTNTTCMVEDAKSCGDTAHNGVESRTMYQDSEVENGGQCVSEQQTRTCTNGDLSAWSGSFKNEACIVGDPKDCGDLSHLGTETRVRYEKSLVGFDLECQSEEQNRTCNDGTLSDWSGSYTKDSCVNEDPKNCGDLNHNSSETRIMFKSEKVSHGGLCESETQSRECHNGELSDWTGSYTQESCQVEDPKNCGDIQHGESEDRLRYESISVNFGETCSSEKQVRTCSDGEMSEWTGSYENSSCIVKDPLTCGDTAHNGEETRTMFKKSSVDHGDVCESEKQVRTCSNGTMSGWSGSFTEVSCIVKDPAACGNTTSGSVETRTRYLESTVAYGGKCESQVQERLCTNGSFGNWSGTYTNESCEVEAAKNCGNIEHGGSESRTRFENSIVGFGDQCKSELQQRTCNNGELGKWSGSYTHLDCSVDVAKSCGDTADGDYEFRKKYKSEVANFGEVCEQEEQKRQCINGNFSEWSGSFEKDKCEAAKPKNCGDVIHGGIEVRVRYETDVINKGESCKSEEQKRECVNGEFGSWSGSYEEETCRRIRNCAFNGGMIPHGENASRVRFRSELVPSGETCEKEEQLALCEDGVIGDFDGSYEHETCDVKGEECHKGKVLTITIDKDGDGLGDTEPVEIISYKGQYNNADNYNYYSWSAHPHIGPNPDGYKSHAYLYEGPDGLSFQFYFNKDKIKGEQYNGSPNSVVKLDILTEGNHFDDAVILADDKNELKYKGEVNGQNLYEGRFHYWYNTDGGVIGPFNGEDYKIIVKPIESYELYKVYGKNERRDAFNGATFYSADGTVVELDDKDGNFHSYIIQFKEEMTCEDHDEQEVADIGCADGSREGFKNLETFADIAGCAGGFSNEGVLPQHRYRDESCKGMGNDSKNPNGEGCGIRNICAKGWEVLPTVSVLSKLTDGKYCHAMEQDDLTGNIAFVTGVTSFGWSKVYDKDEDLLNAILSYEDERENYLATGAKNYKNHVNDLFYCGGKKVAHGPYNNAKTYFTTFSHNACRGASSFSSCKSAGGFFEADRYKQTLNSDMTRGLASTDLKGGGVVCVRSSKVDDLEIEDDLRGEEDEMEKLFCENILVNGSFEEGHSLSGNSWNTFAEVDGWYADSRYSDAAIEIQCGNAGPLATHESCNLELDAHHGKNGFSESDAGVNQVINLKKGKSYSLSFDIFARSSKASSNEMSILVNNEEVFSFKSSDKSWVRKSITFVANRSGRQILSLRGNKDTDTIGANLDNIVLVESECMESQEEDSEVDVDATAPVDHHYNPEKPKQKRFKLSCASLKAGEKIPAKTLSKVPVSLRSHLKKHGISLTKQCGKYKSFYLDYIFNGELEELSVQPNYYK